MAINANHELCKFIVSKCLNTKDIRWPAEIKMAQKLTKLYQGFDFWTKVSAGYNPASLAYFLTPKGLDALARLKLLESVELPAKEKIVLNTEKIGEDKVFKPNKETLIEFLRK